MNNRTLLTALLVVALLGAGWVLGHRQNPANPATSGQPAAEAEAAEGAGMGSKVGFVDIESVYNSCKQMKAIDLEIQQYVDQGQKEIAPQMAPLQQDLKRLKEKIEMLAESAPERKPLEEEFLAKQRKLGTLAEPWEKDLNLRKLKARERLYTLIRTCSERVAKARSIDLLVADIEDPHADLSGESARAVDAALGLYSVKMMQKRVIYAAKSADLTAAVLEAVNAEP